MTVRSSAILASHPVRMCVNNGPGACMRAHSDAYSYLAMLSTCYSSAADVQVVRESPHGSRPAHRKQPQSVLYSVQQVGMATPGCGRDGAAATAAAAAAGAGAGAAENDLDPRHSLVQVAARQLARAAALAQAQQQVHIVHLKGWSCDRVLCLPACVLNGRMHAGGADLAKLGWLGTRPFSDLLLMPSASISCCLLVRQAERGAGGPQSGAVSRAGAVGHGATGPPGRGSCRCCGGGRRHSRAATSAPGAAGVKTRSLLCMCTLLNIDGHGETVMGRLSRPRRALHCHDKCPARDVCADVMY